MPIKKIVQEIGISIRTSFAWRHKILNSLNGFVHEALSSGVEFDELELELNNKGNRNLDRESRKRGSDFNRNKRKEEFTVVQIVTAIERKAVASKRLSKEEISKALDRKLADKATLITDKHLSYKAFVKDNPIIKHKALLAKDHVDRDDKTIHLQKVNNVHSLLRTFLHPFNGVSSKNLQNYLNWHAYTDKIKRSKATLKQWFLTDQAYHRLELFKHN